MSININFIKTNSKAQEPTRDSEYAAGYDLYSLEQHTIESNETLKIGTGIAVEIPHGYFGAVIARSGLATKQGLRLANCLGVIDEDYRGELIVALHNDSNVTRTVNAGERIAQLVIIPYLSVNFTEVYELSDTKRGARGFGSTGIN